MMCALNKIGGNDMDSCAYLCLMQLTFILPLCFGSILVPEGAVAVHRNSGTIPAHIFVPIDSVVPVFILTVVMCTDTMCSCTQV